MSEIETVSFGKQYSNNCFHQESSLYSKIGEQKYDKQDVCIVSKYLPIIYLIIQGKIVTWQWRKLDTHHLNQITKVSITNTDAYWCYVPSDAMYWEGDSSEHHLVAFLLKTHYLNLVMKKKKISQTQTVGHSTK